MAGESPGRPPLPCLLWKDESPTSLEARDRLYLAVYQCVWLAGFDEDGEGHLGVQLTGEKATCILKILRRAQGEVLPWSRFRENKRRRVRNHEGQLNILGFGVLNGWRSSFCPVL